ncbi:MAG: hypothetical protein HFJ58_02235 [Clostridia bacterium]|nr:hypothetical protein [Clostridia bacterium]
MVNSVGNFFSNFWTGFTEGLSNLASNIGNFFNDLGTNLGNWFSNLGTSIGNFFSDLWTNTQNFFSGMVQDISNIWSFFVDFFVNMADFLINIFVPTEEQWQAIQEDYTDLSNTFKNHIPFVTFFSEEVEKVKQEVLNEDFLNLKMSGWDFNLGVIHFKTNDYEFTNVLKAYEPYRMTVRTLLTFVVYAMAFVYIIKYAISYGTTQGLNSVNSSINSKGGTDK